jgi:hypothetical protein
LSLIDSVITVAGNGGLIFSRYILRTDSVIPFNPLRTLFRSANFKFALLHEVETICDRECARCAGSSIIWFNSSRGFQFLWNLGWLLRYRCRQTGRVKI